jgi:hypothetical protein
VNDQDLTGFKPIFAYNSDRSKFFMVLYLSECERILVPILTENATVQKWNMNQTEWVSDNLSTVEYHAKRKGLV